MSKACLCSQKLCGCSLLICLVLVFIYDVTHGSGFILSHVELLLYQHHLLRMIFFFPDGTDKGVVKTKFGLGNGGTLVKGYKAR